MKTNFRYIYVLLPQYIHEDVIALSECDPMKIPDQRESRGMPECLTHIHLVMDPLLLTTMSMSYKVVDRHLIDTNITMTPIAHCL